MAQFDPSSPGSQGVKLDANKAVVLYTSGFQFTSKWIWIANSGEGTESKVDITTNTEVARYCTFPGCNGDPSRSTVSLLGDVVVTNRANYYGFTVPARASAVRINADTSRCVDRNGNGVIDTNTAPGPVPAAFRWAVGQPNSPDECVIWLADLTKNRNGVVIGGAGSLPRAAAFDAVIPPGAKDLATYVYVGLYGSNEVVRLNAQTGALVKQFVTNATPYGFAIDKSGALWIRDAAGANITKIDIPNQDKEYNYAAPPCPYGISADARGYIYTAGGNCVSRFDPTNPTAGWERLTMPNFGSGRGLALDSKYNLYIADTAQGLYAVDASAPFNATTTSMVFKKQITPRGTGNDKYYLGIGIDLNEDPWIVSTGNQNLAAPGGQGIIYHTNPTTFTTTAVNVGLDPYTYSDMTGSQLRFAGSPKGIFRYVFQSDCAPAKTTWTNVTYTVTTPTGTQVGIQSRGASNPTALQSATFGPTTSIPPSAPGPFNPNSVEGVDNSYLELQFTLSAATLGQSPSLQNVKADYICG